MNGVAFPFRFYGKVEVVGLCGVGHGTEQEKQGTYADRRAVLAPAFPDNRIQRFRKFLRRTVFQCKDIRVESAAAFLFDFLFAELFFDLCGKTFSCHYFT